MTKGKQTKGFAPYQPGDTISVRHTCGTDGGTHVTSLKVRRTETVQGFGVASYKWRVVAVRCDGSLLMVDVDHRGFDQHGRVVPPALADGGDV